MYTLLKEAKSIQSILEEYRRFLHMNPELGMELPITTKFVMEKLTEMGLAPKEISPSSIKVVIGKKTGKTVLLRGDMDALPLEEVVDVPYKSKNCNMHACGHDLHTTMLLGAAKLLKAHEDELLGQVVLMFQPAEEVAMGAIMMIEGGILRSPDVDVAMMIHTMVGYPLPNGTIVSLGPGAVTASVNAFRIELIGKGCHGAMPHQGIDPITAMTHLILALQSINAREVESGKIIVLTICEIHSGSKFNVMPDSCYVSGSLRTYDPELRKYALARIENITKATAETFRCSYTLTPGATAPSVMVDPALHEFFMNTTSSLLGKENVMDKDEARRKANFYNLSGSEDFGYISDQVPSILAILSVDGSSGDYQCKPLHHPAAVFEDDKLYVGSASYANFAIEWLKANGK